MYASGYFAKNYYAGTYYSPVGGEVDDIPDGPGLMFKLPRNKCRFLIPRTKPMFKLPSVGHNRIEGQR